MRSRIAIILCLAIAFVYQSCDTTLNVERPGTFLKYIGRDGDQSAVDMVSDASGNIYIAGNSIVDGKTQRMYLVKVSSGGITIWEKLYGNQETETLTAKDIEVLNDGTLAVVSDRSVGNEKDFMIHIIDPETGEEIRSSVGGQPGVEENAMSITQIETGFIVAVAQRERDYLVSYLYKTDANLVETTDLGWTKITRQVNDDNTIGYDFVPVKVYEITPPGSDEKVYYTFGYTKSPGGDGITDFNYFALMTNAGNGGPVLLFIPGESPSSNEQLSSVMRVSDANGSGYALIGYTDARGAQDLRIARVIPDLYSLSSVDIDKPSSFLYGGRLIETITRGLSTTLPGAAGVYYSGAREALVIGQQQLGTAAASIYVDKVQQSQSADATTFYSSMWSSPKIFGGVGNDSPATVLQTDDGHILVCGTMVIGDALGQRKIVIMRLTSEGMLGE